ncbi:hypothetical protein [Chryseobacterium sp. MYb328]|uniref:hypothetical protein n=1 Tax=Chryseobacterium sp. MYb328 TaxID=2745231 RepID=UPI0030983677
MKTPLQQKYLRKLSDLNDHLCFYLFNKQELNDKLSNFTPEDNELFTPDLFPHNSYSKKINVTLKKLPSFQEQNQLINFGSYFSFSYEFFHAYMEDVMEIISYINTVSLTRSEKQNTPIEEQLQLLISKLGHGTPQQEVFDTIKYYRLRRNYITHLLEVLTSGFSDLINDEGENLNLFWKDAVTELDFTNYDIGVITENEIVDLLKIQRILLTIIDKFIAPLLQKEGIAKYICTKRYIQPARINKDIIIERKKTVSKLAIESFGVELTDTEMDHAVKTIGVKK